MEHKVLNYWFKGWKADQATSKSLNELWFNARPETDEEIKRIFEADVEAVANNQDLRVSQSSTAAGTLASIILLDQFPRNMYRGSPKMFKYDKLALELAKGAIRQGQDRLLAPLQRMFVYLPLEHSEDTSHQKESLRLFQILMEENNDSQSLITAYEYAVLHADIIEKFKRFPHRNAILGRTSTLMETEFLERNPNLFGVLKKN